MSVPFTPVIKMPIRDDTDRLAVAMVDRIQADVALTMNTERSKQTTIGISEIGNPCDKCVCRKLSGLYAKEEQGSQGWKAQVGTFIHSGLEGHFDALHPLPQPPIYPGDDATDEHPFYHLERRVHVRTYKSLNLGGSCDMFIEGGSFGIVVDWKTQGTDKLLKKTGAGDIGQTYTVQMHTYGLGYELLGFTVTHVLLYALPRDNELNAARPVLMRYDRQIALDALARIERFIDAAEIVGWEAMIEQAKSARETGGHCFDCPRFERQERSSFLDDILGR